MGELYQGEGGGADRPHEADDFSVQADHRTADITIEEAIRLTARFDQEWFCSFETLDADLSRFAAAFELTLEAVGQVRKAVEALHEDEDGRGKEQEGIPAGIRSYGSPERSAPAA